MAGFVADLAKTYVERVINGAITESRYLCCFTCIAKEFEEEKAKLKAERETMAQRFDVATRRDKDIQGNALNWAEQVDKLLQEDTTAKQTCLFGFCPNCMWRYKRGKELANKTEEIKRQIGKGEKLENVELPRCLPGVEYYSSQDYISFKSRELKYKELLDALKDDTNYITGLQGMGGTGKTTLATEVGKELEQSEQFARVIDTTVSFTPDIKKIQDDIAGPLGLKWEDCNESDRPKKLWSRLTNGEKILLILDDVWGHIDFKQIGIPHSDDHKGCRVLVTTRDLQVCNKMGCEKPIQLDLLSKEDAWIMFKRHARISDSSSKSLLEKGRKIADECKGLPIAIAAIASSLKGQQRLEEWDVALKSLQKPLVSMHDVGDGNLVQICKCLKFSYDYLKDEKAKGLFLLCSVFREDEEISTETLTRLGIGSGLFGEDYDKYDDARLEVIVAKNKLLDSCLLLKGNGGCVKMHDLVRDVAHRIANKEIRAINLSKINQKSLVERENNIKYLLCEGKYKDVTSCRIDGSKLEILIVFFTRDVDHHVVELPNSFFENKAGLRVLHLSNNYGVNRWALSLPQSFQSLANIQSLIVCGIILGDISILGNLQSLETLDLLYCTIDELPHEITTLENFRLLSLKMCEIRGGNPFDVIERCSSLEELYFEYGFERLRGEITFPMLQRFRVINTWHRGNVSLSKYVSFQGDKENGEFYFSEATFKYWMRTAEFLRLRRIHRGWPWRNLIPDIVPIEQGMNELIELHLGSISQLQCLIDTKHIIDSRSQSVFCNLVVLELDRIENLEELCNGPLSFDSLKSLKQLVIRNCIHLRSLFECKLNLCNLRRLKLQECPMLVSLFQLSTSRSLVMLEELDITDCKQLKHIIVDERREEEPGEEKVDGDNDHKSHGSMFHKLKFLKIQGCPQLEFIFGQHQDVELGSLKELILGELPNFIDIFSECYHPMASLVKESSSRDGSMAKIQLDPIKHNIFSWTHICCYGHKHRRKLRSTTTAKIPLVSKDQLQDCSTTLDLSENVEHFLALKYLKIYNCSAENIFCASEINGQQIHLGLQKIELYDMPQMTYIFVGPKNSFALQNLLTIKVVRCENLKMIFSSSISRCLPQLLNLMIVECKELKQIIEEDVENPKMSNSLFPTTCFPTLQALVVENCNKLECVFPASICKELPKLKVMFVIRANALEEIFRCEGDQKVEIPNLTTVMFVRLSNLNQAQGTHFQAVENRLIRNCPKLSLTSAKIDGDIDITCGDMDIDYETWKYLKSLPEDPGTEDQSIQECSESETEDQSIQEGSESEKTITTILSTNSEIMNDPPKPLVAPIQKGIKRSVEEGTALANAKTVSLSNHSKLVGSSSGSLVTSEHEISSQEDGDGQIAIPSFSTATTKPHAATKSVDVGDSKETTETYASSAAEKIDQMIKEDPLIALEKLLTGKVSITEKIGQNPLSQSESEVQSSSVGILLDDLKTLMESSDLDHLVSHQESKSRMISLFQQLNQHQGVLSVEIKDFVKNAHDFFSDYFGKHTTSQHVSKRHNQLLESKTDLMNKLWSAKSTQTHIDNATSTAKTQIHEISLRIDGLRKQLVDLENQRDEFRSAVEKCGLQKKKLMDECTQWAQQSKELLSELASSEVDVQKVELERSLAKEAFANLKSSFPTL